MPAELGLFVGTLLLTAALASALALFAWRRAPAPGARSFALFVLAAVLWLLAYALELASPDPGVKLFWARFQFFGIVGLHPLWLIFALSYTGRERWLAGGRWLILFLIPLATLALIWTNDAHGLFWRSAELQAGAPVAQLRFSRGPWYWVHTGYSYFLYLLGLVLLVGHLLRQARIYRGQAIGLLIGTLVPFAANVIYLYGLFPLPALDPTPFATAVSCLAFTWALFRYRLLDIVPLGYRTVLNVMSDGVIVLDAQGYVVDLNPAAERLTGRSAARAVGQPIERVLTGRPDLLERCLATGQLRDELLLEVAGQARCFDLTVSPVGEPGGRLRGWVVLLHDLTDRYQAARERDRFEREQQERTRAQEAVHLRTEYLSVAAHELRTPITALRGFAQLLLGQLAGDGRVEPDLLPRALQSIDQQSERVARLITQLLDASRLEADRLTLEPSLTNVTRLVERVVAVVQPTADQHTFRLSLEPDLQAVVDPLRLEQVLTNLLDNAVKYSPAGTPIAVGLARLADGRFQLAVADRGPGIPAEARDQIFDRFYQASRSTGSPPGLGLGLYISRQIVERHEGRLWVEQPPEGGTRFVLSLPLGLEQDEALD
jgi:PAS domain S-box-containing protein